MIKFNVARTFIKGLQTFNLSFLELIYKEQPTHKNILTLTPYKLVHF